LNKNFHQFGFFVDKKNNDKVRKSLYEKGYTRNKKTLIRISSGEVRICTISSEKIVFKGEPHLISIAFDVTNHIEALNNLKQTQSQLVQSEKMASLGALVAGVAHEINTPIGVSITASSFLSDSIEKFNYYYNKGKTGQDDLMKILRTVNDASDIIFRNLERAAEIISSFKKVAVDQSDATRRVFIVDAYIDDVLVSLEPKFKRTKHTVKIKCSEKIIIDSWPGAFFQIISNLLFNTLRHGFENIDSGEIVIDIKKKDGQLILKFSDNGKGMEEAVQGKVFDPFFTTKRNQGGTGLGLHIVYNLVTQTLKGSIICNSHLGKGTEFVITAPMEFMDVNLM